MSYQLANADGRTGHALSTLRVEINLGLKKGYSGSVQDKQEVLDFITTIHERLSDRLQILSPLSLPIRYLYMVMKRTANRRPSTSRGYASPAKNRRSMLPTCRTTNGRHWWKPMPRPSENILSRNTFL
jgi:hypothetical protein